MDKLVHLSLFAVLAFTTRARFGRGLVLVLLYAPISELLQTTSVVSRDGDWRDALADVVGALLGWALARWALRRTRSD